jgi:transcription antitermination factor NusG
MPEAPRWCVARTNPSSEHWAHLSLLRVGYEAYLPLCTVRRRDRALRSMFHTVKVPLFRSYLFVQHEPGTSWRPIRSAPGVQTLILVGGRLEYAAEGAVEHLQATEALRRTPDAQEQRFRPGSACRLIAGPFRGHDAAVAEVDGDTVVVTVVMFGELRRVSVPVGCAQPARGLIKRELLVFDARPALSMA